MKNIAKYCSGYPAVEKALKRFIEVKCANPRTLVGSKDRPFTSPILSGINHFHLVHGKVMLVYRVVGDRLEIYDCVEHDAYEGSVKMSIRNYIDGLDHSSFDTLDPDAETSPRLSREMKKTLDDLIYEIAGSDPEVIADALKGDVSLLMEFLIMTAEEDADTIIAAYEGSAALKQYIARVATIYHIT